MRNHNTTTGTKADEFRRIEVITGIGRRAFPTFALRASLTKAMPIM